MNTQGQCSGTLIDSAATENSEIQMEPGPNANLHGQPEQQQYLWYILIFCLYNKLQSQMGLWFWMVYLEPDFVS